YAQLYLDSTPVDHANAYDRLARLGDDSGTYLWRVGAAREIMRLYREDPERLDRLAALQTAKNSAEEVLHPRDETEVFQTPHDLRDAYDREDVVALPRTELAGRGLQIDRGMGELARRLGGSRTTYRGLRSAALALLEYIRAGVE